LSAKGEFREKLQKEGRVTTTPSSIEGDKRKTR